MTAQPNIAWLIRNDTDVREAIKALVEEHVHMTGIRVDLTTGVQSQEQAVEWEGA